MKANQTAGVLLGGAMTTIAAADLLIPVSQERYLEVTAYCYDTNGQSDFVSDFFEAPDFGLFDAALSVSAACGGEGQADQLSEITPDGIIGTGSTYAYSYYMPNYGLQAGTGHSCCSATFEVVGWTHMILTGYVAVSTQKGYGTVAFSLSDSVQVLIERELEVIPYGGSMQEFVDERIWLEAGRYTLLFRAASTEDGMCGTDSFTVADFDFQMQLVLEEPCAADCFPIGGDGVVDVLDLILLLAEWGSTNSPADIAPGPGDGIVDVQDLLLVLGQWGPCPR